MLNKTMKNFIMRRNQRLEPDTSTVFRESMLKKNLLGWVTSCKMETFSRGFHYEDESNMRVGNERSL
jgi:hypothetical protein